MKIKSNYEELKKEERAYCSNFFQKYYKQEPKYIPINIKRPDCYYEVSDKKYIVEMTTYFIQEEEQQIYRLKNDVEKIIKNNDWLKVAHKKFKRAKEPITILYNSRKEIINDLLISKKVIKQLSVDKKIYWFNDNINTFSTAYKIGSISLRHFIEKFENMNNNFEEITVTLNNSCNFTFSLRYSPIMLTRK